MAISIRGIAYELGELRDIGTIDAPPDAVAALRTAGLATYSASPLSPADLAKNAARKTLELAGVSGADVDAVVFASESFWNISVDRADVPKMMASLGMERAYPIGTFMSGCNNFAVALRIARGLVQDGMTNVLVACADTVPEGPKTRVLEPNMSVLSDGAVSFIVGKTEGEYELVNLGFHSSPALANVDPNEDMATWAMGNIEGVRQAVARALEPLESDPKRVARFFCNNYSHAVAGMFAMQAGFEDAQCYFDNVGRFAHAYASDTFINLVDCEAARPMARGELAVLLGSSATNWGAAVLRKS